MEPRVAGPSLKGRAAGSLGQAGLFYPFGGSHPPDSSWALSFLSESEVCVGWSILTLGSQAPSQVSAGPLQALTGGFSVSKNAWKTHPSNLSL